MRRNQRGKAIIIFYINSVLGMISNLILTPLLISALTDEYYSIYKVMHSFVGPLIMLNMGLSTIVARCIAKYRATDGKDEVEKKNTFALAIIIAVLMAILIEIIGSLMAWMVPTVYANTYNPEQIQLAKNLCYIFMSTTAIGVISDVFKGCALGNERFIFYYILQTVQHILRFALIVVLLNIGLGAIELAAADLVVAAVILAILLFYTLFILNERPKLYCINKNELKSIFAFSLAIILQALINQVNDNMDNVILGAMVSNKEVITMYSSALTIYMIYNSLISVFSNVYLPEATKLVTRGADGEELTDFVIKPGRIQALIATAIIFGFAICGYNFISVWIGEKYTNAYYVILMLMIPVTIPLVQNVCLAILDAKLKRMYRSVVLAIMALINVIVSIALVHYLSFWGAALGTVLSLVFGHCILMNIYYQKQIGLNVIRMFKSIFKGILPAGALAAVISSPAAILLNNTWIHFLIKGVLFITLYGICIFLFGLNNDEKKLFKYRAQRIMKK